MRSLDRLFKSRLNGTGLKPLVQYIKDLFSNNEQGVWYDPSDFERYMSALGPELVTNGDFSQGVTGWSGANGGVLSVSNGEITVTNGVTSVGRAAQMITTEIGKTYLLTAAARIGSATSAQLGWGTVLGSLAGGSVTTTSATATTLSMTFVATTTSTGVVVGNGSTTTGNTSIFDNISVRELTAINTATLYQDAAGTIPVTAVEQPVGLMLDKSKGLILRSELVINGTFDVDANWTKNSGWGIADGKATKTPGTAGTLVQLYALTPGKTYKVTYEVSGRTAGQCTAVFVGGTTVGEGVHSNNGFRSCILTAVTGNGTFGISADSLFNGSIDNFSVRELPGNHASQITATSRPVLSARVNQFLNSELTGAVAGAPGTPPTSWANGNTAGEIGASTEGTRFVANNSRRTIYQSFSAQANSVWVFSCKVRIEKTSSIQQLFGSTSPTAASIAYYVGGALVPAHFAPAVGEHEIECAVTVNSTGGTTVFQLGVGVQNNTTGDVTFLRADLRPANTGTNLPDYQRVNTATDYDTVGFPAYLKFDGTDDWLATPSIDFTGTDKMMVCAGARKLSNATAGILVELGYASPSAFWFGAPGNALTEDIFNFSDVDGSRNVRLSTAAPITGVYSSRADFGAKTIDGRINTSPMVAVGSFGSGGTYGNYPLYIGRRAGVSLPFRGHLYGLIIRGAATSDSQIKSVERYVNTKTRAYTT